MDLIDRQKAIYLLEEQLDYLHMLNSKENPTAEFNWYGVNWARNTIADMPSAEQEVIPHRNYKFLSDYWCQCGWHLGKKGEVKYCANCGRKVKWDGSD